MWSDRSRVCTSHLSPGGRRGTAPAALPPRCPSGCEPAAAGETTLGGRARTRTDPTAEQQKPAHLTLARSDPDDSTDLAGPILAETNRSSETVADRQGGSAWAVGVGRRRGPLGSPPHPHKLVGSFLHGGFPRQPPDTLSWRSHSHSLYDPLPPPPPHTALLPQDKSAVQLFRYKRKGAAPRCGPRFSW